MNFSDLRINRDDTINIHSRDASNNRPRFKSKTFFIKGSTIEFPSPHSLAFHRISTELPFSLSLFSERITIE